MPESPPRLVDGLGAVADRYDGFIVDQWGVLHDGVEAYPGATDALDELARRGKRVVLLSNSGRRAAANGRRLAGLGFAPERFAGVVTSGEACWRLLRRRAGPPWDGLGRRCYLLTILDDETVIDGLGLERVAEVRNADFVLATGLEDWHTPEEMARIAAAGVARGLPVVCSNPDLVAVTRGELVTAPGTFAKLYEEAGGVVHYVGKPHRPIYEACFEALGGLDPRRIACVGDSLEHDIRGANGVGLDSVFVEDGIHGAEFPTGADPDRRLATLDRLTAADPEATRPTWAMHRFRW